MKGMGWSVTGDVEVPETFLALCSASPGSDPAQGLPEAVGSFWGSGLGGAPPRQGCQAGTGLTRETVPGCRGEQGHQKVPVPRCYPWVCSAPSSTGWPQNRAAPRGSQSPNPHTSSCASNRGPCSALAGSGLAPPALHGATFLGTNHAAKQVKNTQGPHSRGM